MQTKKTCLPTNLLHEHMLYQEAVKKTRQNGLSICLKDGRTVKIYSLTNRKVIGAASIVDECHKTRAPLLTRKNNPQAWSDSGLAEISVAGETVYLIYFTLPDDDVSELATLVHRSLHPKKWGEPPYRDAALVIYNNHVYAGNSRTGQLIIRAAKNNQKPEIEAVTSN